MIEPTAEKYQEYQIIADHIENRIIKVNVDTAALSNLSATRLHASFVELTQMGTRIIPFIVHHMVTNGVTWTHLLLLAEISKANPVPKEHAGRFYFMVADWLNWYMASEYRQLDDVYHGLISDS